MPRVWRTHVQEEYLFETPEAELLTLQQGQFANYVAGGGTVGSLVDSSVRCRRFLLSLHLSVNAILNIPSGRGTQYMAGAA